MPTRTSGERLCAISRNVCLQFTLALALAGSLPASAGSLAIAPLRVSLSSAAGIASVTVTNNGREEALVQAETYAWSQSAGENKLSPTQDVVAVPPIFRLAPGAQQRIRVGLTRAFTDASEQTFRLTVTEVPTVTAPGVIAVAIRHSLPVFVLPPTPVAPDLGVKPGTPGGLEIVNRGTRHLRILRWRLRDDRGNVMAEDEGPGYLLAGASQRLVVAGGRILETAVFEADSDTRTLKIPVGG